MTTYTEIEEFLKAIFGDDYGTHALFANLNPPAHTRDFRQLNLNRDCYWSIAAYPPGYNGTNTEDEALEVRALVIDDVGTTGPSEGAVRLALGEPTVVTLTSPGNFQWGYRLAKPVAKDDWSGFFGGIEALIQHDKPLHARAAQTLVRLPMGKNTKPHNKGFTVQRVKVNLGVVLDPDTIVRVKVARPGPSKGIPRVHNIKAMLAALPNDVEYDPWIEIGQRALALAVDKEDCHEAWHEFSSRTTLKVYDYGYSEARWISFTADRTNGGLLLDAVQKLGGAAVDAWWQSEAKFVFDDGATPPKERRKVAFSEGEKGQILSTMDNAARGLWGLGVECRYDEFHHRFYVGDERLTDHLVLLLRVEINGVWGKDFGDKHMLDAITALGLKNRFNPVVEMLAEAQRDWDGVARLDRLGPDYFHTEDTELARACFRKVMIAAVRRARRPGCKFDQILVLESPEGWDKSTAWAVLAGEGNFSDASILGKDARAVQEELADVWIHEIADLSGLVKAEVELVKAFASRVNDRARPAYGKVLLDQPRQSIEVGTTNSDNYLMAQTGNRRFWPFELEFPVETARLAADRLQLWGEAAAAEAKGETLVLDRTLWGDAAAAQEERRVVDPWEDELANLPDHLIKDVGGYQTITNVAIHDHLSGHRGGQLTGASGRTINGIMKRHGWKKARIRDAVGKEVRGYRRRTDNNASVRASVGENPF